MPIKLANNYVGTCCHLLQNLHSVHLNLGHWLWHEMERLGKQADPDPCLLGQDLKH